MGDLNGHIGDRVIPGIKQRCNDADVNQSGEDLLEFCTLNKLRITNTFVYHKPQHKYTWMDKRDRKSTIDFIIITNKSIHQTKKYQM